jgi:hypothetical protein
MNKEDLPPKRLKILPQTLGSRRVPIRDEVKEARNTPAYWWYKTLQASDEYVYCCEHNGQGRLASLYKDFGDVRKDFTPWWLTVGRKIFAEKKPLKKVKVIDADTFEDLILRKDRLIVEIPLTMRKQTIMRQIGKHLKNAQDAREPVDVWKSSSAKRQVIKSKVRMTTVEMLLKVLAIRVKYPSLNNYEIGLKAGIDLDIYARDTSGVDIDLSIEKRRMTIAVSRYLGQARNLIANAEMGIFPSLNEQKIIK